MSTFGLTIDTLSGFGASHQFVMMKQGEDEIKQGKNYYNASLFVSGETIVFATMVSRIATHFFTGMTNVVIQISAEVVPLLLIPINVLFASIRQKDYEDFARYWNTNVCSFLPENLSETTRDIAVFFTEHTGDMIQVAMAVSILVLLILGDFAFGIPALIAALYQLLATSGWIPNTIALYLENYLPLLSLTGTLLGGSIVMRVMALMMLPRYLMPSLHEYLLEKLDHLYRYFFPVYGPTLEEINTECVTHKELTYDQINEILDADTNTFELNPAHCSKPAFDLSVLPQDADFDTFMRLFKEVDWTQRYTLIRARLKDDEIFVGDVLAKQFPAVDKAVFKDNYEFDAFLQEIADKQGLSKEQFAAHWVEAQMSILVDVLKGNRVVKGSLSDLAEAVEDNKRLIAYLKTHTGDRVTVEDILLKVAIEEGDYCALGLKRASKELCLQIVQEFCAATSHGLIADFELQLRLFLEAERIRRVEICYQKGVTLFSKVDMGNLLADVHNFDLFRKIFSFGYIPMTTNEKSKFGFLDLILWDQRLPSALRSTFYWEKNRIFRNAEYLTEGLKKQGFTSFWDYIRGVINANPKLSPEQQETIIDKMSTWNAGQWTGPETQEKFVRLAYYMLGIMQRKDPNNAPPVPVFFRDYPSAWDEIISHA